jgi:putative MFS transporter
MATNIGARLDRLPVSSFHYRIFWLIGAGMFFDGYDLYVGASVLGAMLQEKFATLPNVAQFNSLTYFGLTIGSLVAGFVGDKLGRRFTYQVNLIIFGLASFAAALAPDISTLNWCRFVQGLGLGAEIVVGYSTLTEFVPPKSRGKWLAFMVFGVVSGFPITVLLGNLIIPAFGWRPMFAIAGVGALFVWYLRKSLPESPRWLELQGRTQEAEAIVQAIEKESAVGAILPPPVAVQPVRNLGFASLFTAQYLPRIIVGSVVLVSINTLIAGFVLWLPTFFVAQGLTITRSLAYTLVIAIGSLVGCALGAYLPDGVGRKKAIIGDSIATVIFGVIYPYTTQNPTLLLSVGFLLIVSIYVQTAMLFGVYSTELFPTEVRLRGNGFCNTLGRAATIVSPFATAYLFGLYGVAGVIGMLIGLLILQIVVVATMGIEPAKRGLEELDQGAVA